MYLITYMYAVTMVTGARVLENTKATSKFELESNF